MMIITLWQDHSVTHKVLVTLFLDVPHGAMGGWQNYSCYSALAWRILQVATSNKTVTKALCYLFPSDPDTVY